MMGFEVRHANHEVGLGHVIGQRASVCGGDV
jgi:hypothetical protein